MLNNIVEMQVDISVIDALLDDYVNKNDIQLKDNDVYINGEAMARAGFAALMRFCYLMLISSDKNKRKFAIEILENIKFYDDGFVALTFCRILKNHRERLTSQAEKRIFEFLESMRELHLSEYYDFQGVNDNFPMMALYYCMIYGDITNDAELLNKAKERFCQIEELLKLRGTFSEYCSIGYTPLQLSILSSLVNDATTEQYKKIALAAEIRVWTDYISHFNPSTGVLNGPFSRAYTDAITGDRPCCPIFFNMLLQPDVQIDYGCLTEGNAPHVVFAPLYYSCFKYHITPEIKELLTNREYPFRYEATSEISSSADDSELNNYIRDYTKEDNFYEYPAGEIQQHLYMTEKYSVGTATREFHNGIQTDSFFVSYKRCEKPTKMSDVRSVFAKFIINDSEKENPYIIHDYGRKLAIQKDNCAMVLYKPKLLRDWKNEREYEAREISSLRLCVFLPKKYSKPDKIVLGNKTLDNFNAQSKKCESVYIKDGDVYMAFHPLCIDDKGRNAAVEIEENDEYIVISFVNYKGEGRKFSERDILHIRNGFICQVSSSDESESFEKFIEESEKYTLTDEYINTPHTRQTLMRRVVFEKDNLKLSCEYNPASEGIKRIACDDRIITAQKMKLTGFDVNELLYM